MADELKMDFYGSASEVEEVFNRIQPVRAGRSSKGAQVLKQFLDSNKAMAGINFDGTPEQAKKERDNLAISIRNAMEEDQRETIWVRKVRGQTDVLFLIDLAKAPKSVREDWEADKRATAARLAGRKK